MTSEVHEPPHATSALPGLQGAIGPDPEDFRVEELPAYLPSGEGEHLYVELEKRELSTPDLVRRVAEAAAVEARDIGYAGLKDKHAVTSQWLSLPGRAKPPESWILSDGIRVLRASRHGNKLRTGHLNGNRFRIGLVGVDTEALSRAQAIADHLRQHGMPNYFGAQRFGRGGENVARALGWLAGGGRARLSPFLLKLYPSVVQSEVFNRYLTLRAAEGLDRALIGEVVRLEGSYASFVVEDPEAETRRWLARDIQLTGPMPGPKMRPASGRPSQLETQAAAALGLDERSAQVLAKFAPGARRDLLVFAKDLAISAGEPGRLWLEFSLPAGSYATVLVRELLRGRLLDPDAQRGADA
jgi:tRNA pseudouridine13 synthase